MALAAAPTVVDVSDAPVRSAPIARVTQCDGYTLVSLEGEHDIASMFDVAGSFAIAIALDDADLVVDLSKVEFMGAETIGVLIRARKYLEDQSRSLTLLKPAPCAQRVLDLCDFTPRPSLVAPLV